MGCGSCGTATGGKPSGCQSNGGCSTGGCNRLNVFDWLSTVPLQDNARIYSIIEVSFSKGSRKEFFRNQSNHYFKKGEAVAVEGMGGYDVGQVSLTGELVKLQLKKYGVTDASVTKRVLHPATTEEIEAQHIQKEREHEVMVRARAICKSLNVDMKMCEVEIQADGKKGTFFYTADNRVDFRELIKVLAGDFKMKVEMRQIGARQESGKVGGIGSCGRELCCSTWLTDFKSVNTTSARYQNLAINQVKLSGQCGRLKCCLNYELDTYMDALKVFPDHVETLDTIKGTITLQKRDIFKNLMWYSYSDNNKQYPLTITRVKEISLLNKKGQKAEELLPAELDIKDSIDDVKPNMGYVNDVGQLTLKALDKKSKKKHDNNKQQAGGNRNNPNPQQQQGKPQGQRPPQKTSDQVQTEDANPDTDTTGRAPAQQGQRPQQQGQRPQQQGQKLQGPRPQQQGQQQGPRPQQGQQQGPRPQQGQQQGPRPQQGQPQGPRPQQGQPQGPRPQQGQPQGPRPQQQGQQQGQRPPQQGQQQGPRQQQQGQNRPPRPQGNNRTEQPDRQKQDGNNSDKPEQPTPNE